jgi:hypothetical protein
MVDRGRSLASVLPLSQLISGTICIKAFSVVKSASHSAKKAPRLNRATRVFVVILKVGSCQDVSMPSTLEGTGIGSNDASARSGP